MKVLSKLSYVNPLRAKWVAYLYDHICNEKEMIEKGFDATGISKGLENAWNIFKTIEKFRQQIPVNL